MEQHLNEFTSEFMKFMASATRDPKKKEINSNMKKLGILNEKDYTINDDYTVDLKCHTIITAKKIEECPVVFNLCDGNFIWHYTDLKSMKNLPKQVNGNMSVAHNALITLEDCPTLVTDQFNCSGNKLKNLKGCEKMMTKLFIAMGCDLKSLEGSPREVSGDFLVGMNDLKSLVGGPIEIDGIYDCSNNNLTNLEGLGKCKKVNSGNNPISETKKDEPKPKEEQKEEENKFLDGDLIIYNNSKSQYNGMIGTIIKNVDLYGVTFKMKDNPILPRDAGIFNVKPQHMEKYVKNKLKKETKKEPATKKEKDQFKNGDKIIYLDPDGEFDDCKGYISYSFNDIVDIKLIKNGKIKWMTNVDSSKLEKIPDEKEIKKFKVGDIIRYTNNDSPFDGQIGKIEDIKNKSCSINLKLKSGTVQLSTHIDNIILLEEASDSTKFTYGQIVIYNNPVSKSFGRIGIFEGTNANGKTTIKFDDDKSYMKLILDPEEAEFIESYNGQLPKKNGYKAGTTYTSPKKKKKIPERVKPILVYNRRNVARKTYGKPGEIVIEPQIETPDENKGIEIDSL